MYLESSDFEFVNLKMRNNVAWWGVGNDIFESGTSYTCHSLCELGQYDADCDMADASSSYQCAINCGANCIPCAAGKASDITGAVSERDCEVFQCLPLSRAHLIAI